MEAQRKRHATGRVSKKQWLDSALEVLAAEGVSAVRVDRLAKQLNISRSGFYWHFADRAALLDEMKAYWRHAFTESFVEEPGEVGLSSDDRLRALSASLRRAGASRFDLAFWSWAQLDGDVRQLVATVRDVRRKHVRRLLGDAGFEGIDLDARERLFVVYHSWGGQMYPATPGSADDAAVDRILDILLRRD